MSVTEPDMGTQPSSRTERGGQRLDIASVSGKLTPILDAQGVREAYEALQEKLTAGCQGLDRTVGFPGGNLPSRLFWNPRLRFWSGFRLSRNAKRFVSWYGLTDPATSTMSNITCEVNFPLEGVNRRIAGVFVTDDRGRVFVAHSGRIGGGRKGISKSAFTRYFREGETAIVKWPDMDIPFYVLGALDSPDLPDRIASFVRAVDRFKAAATGG